MMHQLSNHAPLTPMASLKIQKFRVGVPFAKECEARSLPGNGPAERSHAKTFHLQFIAKEGFFRGEGS
jgi:hypothetical protein